jgi:hypothetical protein
MTSELATRALQHAISDRRPVGTIRSQRQRLPISFHETCQLALGQRSERINGQGGACGDNAAMESFNALLQVNVLDRQRWQTRANSAKQSPTGSKRNTTADDANADSVDKHPSTLRNSTSHPTTGLTPKPKPSTKQWADPRSIAADSMRMQRDMSSSSYA